MNNKVTAIFVIAVFLRLKINMVREIKFTDVITDEVDLENFYSIQDAKDYSEFVIEGVYSFEECAKKSEIFE